MVRARDACWEHCVLIDATRQKVRCNYCRREFSGGVYRMKFHLAQVRNKDIIPCAEVPGNVRDKILSILRAPKRQRTPKKMKLEHAANGQQDSSSASGGFHPHRASCGQNDSSSPSLHFPCPSPSPKEPADGSQRQKEDAADSKIAAFFFLNSVPFSAAKSMHYREMVDAIAECGIGYKPPTYDKLRCNLLQKLKCDVNDHHQKLRDAWKDTGCTIFCDSWSDGGTKSIVVFSVTCPKGTLYLRSIDISGHEEDSHYMFALLESVVQEISVENVVQVITDSAPARTYAGRLLMDKYPSLFWSPCASHCINKMFEDLSKQEWVNAVLENTSNVIRFMYSNDWILKMMKKFTGGRQLIRPKHKRFVSNFLSLLSFTIHEDNLKEMFCHAEWLSSNYGGRPEAQTIKSLLFLETFWKSAREVVSVSEPLIKLLRVVDGDMPAMGYIYEGMERAKLTIKEYYKGVEEKSVPILEIIDRRWNVLVHSPLHAAAAFLNPSIFYSRSFKADARIRNGFQDAMLKMATKDIDKIEITKEHPVYINAQGAFGTEFAIKGRTLNAAGDWWAGYGYEIPTLQKYAIRILSQPCSSHWCGWNWNTFESIHNKRHNRLELEKFNDLVFVHCNLWLQAIARSRDAKCKPIHFDEIDVISEWPTVSEASPRLLDDSWLDNLPLDYR